MIIWILGPCRCTLGYLSSHVYLSKTRYGYSWQYSVFRPIFIEMFFFYFIEVITIVEGENQMAEIGSMMTITCRAEGGIASGGLTIAQTSGSNNTTCSITGSATVDCGSGIILIGTLNNDIMQAVLTFSTECEDEGSFECFSVGSSTAKAVTNLEVTSKGNLYTSV